MDHYFGPSHPTKKKKQILYILLCKLYTFKQTKAKLFGLLENIGYFSTSSITARLIDTMSSF